MKQLSHKILNKNPVVLTFHINWKMYENFHTNQFKHIVSMFRMHGIHLELLPIVTSRTTPIEKRVELFKNGIEKICDKYERKAHVIGYSFAGYNPKAFIGYYEGHNYIDSLLTVSTPHK